jgi:hypothetical protein
MQWLATPRVPMSRLTVSGIALIVGLVAAGVAGAATDALSVGDVIPGGEPSPTAHRLSVAETVIATGVSAVGGPWRMTAYESEPSAAQPESLPCVRLVLTASPAETPVGGSGFCGELDDGFGAVSLPVVNSSGQAEVLIFGLVPELASTVELTAADRTIRVATRDGGQSFGRGNVFVLPVATGATHGELVALDQKGDPVSQKIDASGFFDRLQAVQAIAR